MAKRITNHSRYVNGAEDDFCPAFLRKRAFHLIFLIPVLVVLLLGILLLAVLCSQ